MPLNPYYFIRLLKCIVQYEWVESRVILGGEAKPTRFAFDDYVTSAFVLCKLTSNTRNEANQKCSLFN